VSCVSAGRAHAEDILQEVYVNVWRAASGFDAAQSQPLTWLTEHCAQSAIDSLRRAQTQPQLQRHGTDDEDSDVYDRPPTTDRARSNC
jgi:RNA polymerase sigma-70 factor (ECF subfamily)